MRGCASVGSASMSINTSPTVKACTLYTVDCQCIVGVNVANKQSTRLFRRISIYILSLSTYINLRVGGDI